MLEITDGMLTELRKTVLGEMSPKRFRHTLAVEEMVARLCELFCPEETGHLRAAALLHDLTKEKKTEEQQELCRVHGLSVTDEDLLAPKTFHARTAAARIGRDFPAYADPTVVNAVRWHTTGHRGMTLTEKLLYLADYIDDSRSFENCVILRRYFWGADPKSMTEAERERLLCDTLLLSYDMTIRDLIAEGAPVAIDTVEARNELLAERAKRT